jgi:hypothetical protein
LARPASAVINIRAARSFGTAGRYGDLGSTLEQEKSQKKLILEKLRNSSVVQQRREMANADSSNLIMSLNFLSSTDEVQYAFDPRKDTNFKKRLDSYAKE